MKLTKVMLTVISCVMLGASAPELLAADGVWLTDFQKAREISKKSDLPIFAYFTGSDWCGWCVRLKKEVLHQQQFKNYAKDNLVLLELDFPRRKKLPDALAKQNNELMKKYGVRGFPSILLLDAEGKVLGRTGYRKGGPDEYIKHLIEMIKNAGSKEKAQDEKPDGGK